MPPRAAALTGYASGLVFFGFGFSWFGETAGSLVGPFAPLLVLGPASVEALAFAFAALVASFAARRLDVRVVPLVAAAAFALFEAMRSEGVLGVPFSQIGVAMVASPLRPLAAFIGGYGLTFATVLCGASLGWWLLAARDLRRLSVAVACWALVVAGTLAAFALWPARSSLAATTRVAAIQGGIEQSLKATPDGVALALQRYTTLTQSLQAAHAKLILWPETVIMTDVLASPQLETQFAALARQTGAVLYVGNVPAVPGIGPTNALAIFDPRVPGDRPAALYEKEQLVPFAEYVPGPEWLRSLPLAQNVGAYNPGRNVRETYDGAAPLICWESVFGDLAHERLRE
ncbi:MAG: apolipoprotein N-acyltransferase, partial [Candidatus Eremiobacteraeota bacterium]|nr:apolipoprotein N-acyltransferase [Candidatus Eremiobacteraeota bacterium]